MKAQRKRKKKKINENRKREKRIQNELWIEWVETTFRESNKKRKLNRKKVKRKKSVAGKSSVWGNLSIHAYTHAYLLIISIYIYTYIHTYIHTHKHKYVKRIFFNYSKSSSNIISLLLICYQVNKYTHSSTEEKKFEKVKIKVKIKWDKKGRRKRNECANYMYIRVTVSLPLCECISEWVNGPKSPSFIAFKQQIQSISLSEKYVLKWWKAESKFNQKNKTGEKSNSILLCVNLFEF